MKNNTIAKLTFLFFIAIMTFLILSDCTKEYVISEQASLDCPIVKDAIIGEWWFVKGHHNDCWYSFESEPCYLKFMYYCDSLTSDDTLYLDEPFLNASNLIGEAYFIFTSKTTVDSTICHYEITQHREFFNDVLNNNAICDIPNHLIEFDACCMLHEIGDTLRIYKR